ncbi:hypothetical protein T01_8627 [Trichinella spiralis]|uniref:Uncharacterized protein n=1 Tax=Trichinella spiralis TaxID=6334 RepID=A0A0V1AQE2_TRISP|nr:hypothetical protein T01_8627 [Trichinella spiralis]
MKKLLNTYGNEESLLELTECIHVQDVAKLRRKAVTTKLGYSIYRRNSNRSGLQGTLPTGNFNAHANATLIKESDERGWAEQCRYPP